MPRIELEYPLLNLNTFGVKASAGMFAAPSTLEELSGVLDSLDQRTLPLLVLGEGSNVLITEDIPGLVIKPSMTGIEFVEEDDEQVLISAGASVNWDSFVEYTLLNGWFGLENLSLIPGSVGSAPVQNIGAYGKELKDHVEWLEAWDIKAGKPVKLLNKDCRFGYRNSIFKGKDKGRYIITRVVFRLSKTPELNLGYGHIGAAFQEAGGSTAMDLRNVVISVRRKKLPDPAEFGNAGSFFKNPVIDRTLFKCIRVDYEDIPGYREPGNLVKIPAAYLIEKAGWKGKKIGNVGTWPAQPLVIVNYGNATGREILEFSLKIEEEVERLFGISLEREVRVI